MKKALALALLLLPTSACAENVTDVAGASSKFDFAKPDDRCGEILYFDFGSPVDGAAYYTDTKGNILAHCGGQRRGMRGKDVDPSLLVCPPAGWTCPHPDVMAIMERHNATKLETPRQNKGN